jgi:hypothetical protein
MKIATENHPIEKALQEVEAVMQKHGMRIYYSYDGLELDMNGTSYKMKDIETREKVLQIPRFADSERIIVSD